MEQLSNKANYKVGAINSETNFKVGLNDSVVGQPIVDDPDFDDFKENVPVVAVPTFSIANSVKVSHEVANELVAATNRLADEHTEIALKKVLERVKSLTTPNALNSFLSVLGSSTRHGGAGRGKIPCQPTSIARRKEGTPRGAAPLCKGRRPKSISSQPKRPRNLSQNSIIFVLYLY